MMLCFNIFVHAGFEPHAGMYIVYQTFKSGIVSCKVLAKCMFMMPWQCHSRQVVAAHNCWPGDDDSSDAESTLPRHLFTF